MLQYVASLTDNENQLKPVRSKGNPPRSGFVICSVIAVVRSALRLAQFLT